jgi:hypothetical protein
VVRLNFHQYVPSFHFLQRKGVTYLTEVRLFKWAKEKEEKTPADPRTLGSGR